jgi:isohexenylglutaconyl-CoA hydratase
MAELPTTPTLLLDRAGSTLRVTINRPETRNAMTDEVVADLHAVCGLCEHAPDVRTLVLRGADGTFCAGGDIKGFRRSFETPLPERGPDPIATFNRTFGDFLVRFNALPQTVVGVIEGAAFGGGLGLVCVTDIAIARSDTRFALSETGLGIPPAQIAPFVVQRVGLTTARRIALSGARFKGDAALAMGLVHYACPDADALEATLDAVLGDIDRCAPGANAATKRILLDVGTRPVGQVLDDASLAFARALRGPEGQEGVKAFLEKRPARWVERT